MPDLSGIKATTIVILDQGAQTFSFERHRLWRRTHCHADHADDRRLLCGLMTVWFYTRMGSHLHTANANPCAPSY